MKSYVKGTSFVQFSGRIYAFLSSFSERKFAAFEAGHFILKSGFVQRFPNDFYKTFNQSSLLPQSSTATNIQIIRDAELQKLKEDFAARRQFNKQSIAQLEKEFNVEHKAYEKQVTGQEQELKKAAKGTEEFCRAIFFGNVEKNRFECPNYGTHNYSTILEQGWIVSNRLPRQVNNMVQQGVMYDVVFKKVR